MAQWWGHSLPTNVARVRFPYSASYVGWVCCWFSSFLREVFLRVLRNLSTTATNLVVLLTDAPLKKPFFRRKDQKQSLFSEEHNRAKKARCEHAKGSCRDFYRNYYVKARLKCSRGVDSCLFRGCPWRERKTCHRHDSCVQPTTCSQSLVLQYLIIEP